MVGYNKNAYSLECLLAIYKPLYHRPHIVQSSPFLSFFDIHWNSVALLRIEDGKV